MTVSFISPDDIRSDFSMAMSAMYRDEVPAYATLMSLVAKVNSATLAADQHLKERLEATDTLERISEERHGAIRLGSPEELSMMRRVFAVMGMYPVGYYDLFHSWCSRSFHGLPPSWRKEPQPQSFPRFHLATSA